MKKFMKFALCAAVALVFTSCGKSAKEAAKEVWDIQQEAIILEQEGDKEAAAEKWAESYSLTNKYADDQEFFVEFRKLSEQKINKEKGDTVR